MSAGDQIWATLHFKRELIQRFQAIQPDYFWLIVSDGDPGVISQCNDAPSVFFILCKPLTKASEEVGFFASVRCEGESYYQADDQTKWVNKVAEQALAQLRKK